MEPEIGVRARFSYESVSDTCLTPRWRRSWARTGGATIILGVLLLLLALFLSGSVEALFNILPRSILGVILFITGAQLALGSCDFSKDKGERFITLVTAAFCVWNVGLGFLAGMVGAYLNRRGLLKL